MQLVVLGRFLIRNSLGKDGYSNDSGGGGGGRDCDGQQHHDDAESKYDECNDGHPNDVHSNDDHS